MPGTSGTIDVSFKGGAVLMPTTNPVATANGVKYYAIPPTCIY